MKQIVGFLICLAAVSLGVGAGTASAQPQIDGKAIVCDTFDQYGVNVKSVKWIGDYLIDSKNQTPSGAATLIQLSVINFCPEFTEDFDALNEQAAKDQHPGNPLFN